MTTTATRVDRQARRLALIGLIRRASEELVELERADHRSAQFTGDRTTVAPASRAVPPPRVTPSGLPAAHIRPQLIRAWALEQGYTLASRGTVPHNIRQAYADAHAEAHQ